MKNVVKIPLIISGVAIASFSLGATASLVVAAIDIAQQKGQKPTEAFKEYGGELLAELVDNAFGVIATLVESWGEELEAEYS